MLGGGNLVVSHNINNNKFYSSLYYAGIPPANMASQRTITVQSVDLKGRPMIGMWTTVSKDGTTVQAGYTPLTFAAQDAATYVIIEANYKQHIFDHWNDGTRTSERSVTPTQDMP